MDTFFQDRLAKSNASTLSRNAIRFFVLKNPEYMSELVGIATDLSNKNHHKAIWIIELLVEDHTEMLVPYLDRIIETIPKYKHESAIRGMSRTAYFLSTSKSISLTEDQQEKLIEIGLDWLINNVKTAPAAFAMKTLFELGKKQPWVHDELKILISRATAKPTPGYTAAVKNTMKALTKEDAK